MSVKIRLMRIGAKKRPFYRVVVVDEQRKRTGGYIELLGTYNPLTKPKQIILKQDRIDDWLKKGAQPSDGFLRIIGKAPQRPPRKPKKEKAPEAAAPATPPPAEEAEGAESDEVPPIEESSPEAPMESTEVKMGDSATQTEQSEKTISEEPKKE